MNSPANGPKATVERYLRAIADRDAATVLGLLGEDVEFWIAGDHPVCGTWKGRDAVVGGFLLPLGALFDPGAGYTIEVRSMIADGDQVAVECLSRSVTKDKVPYENRIVSVYTVADGRITRMHEYFDTAYFAKTLAAR
ncbi:nuclear transport factor 2 family protein [Streptomyces sp. NPDC016845]|uniref:nuclear transport factor 2 family protein n=1 Tax=Streptomyces sp. NPDC016845 TaxID=3364972 RepID=UPI00379E9528